MNGAGSTATTIEARLAENLTDRNLTNVVLVGMGFVPPHLVNVVRRSESERERERARTDSARIPDGFRTCLIDHGDGSLPSPVKTGRGRWWQ